MTYDEKEKLVQSYLGGELSKEKESELSSQIAQDEELKKLVDNYSEMIAQLSSAGTIAPPPDLWKRKIRPAVSHEIAEQTTSTKPLKLGWFSMQGFRPAIAGVGFLLVIVVSTIMLQNVLMPETREPYDVALEKIEELRQEYTQQLGILLAEMQKRKDNLHPIYQEQYDEVMNLHDDLIAKAERNYAIYSSDEEAVIQLMRAYDNKAMAIQGFLDMSM